MDGNYFPFPSDGSFSAFDQSLEFISEDFAPDENRRSMSSVNTLGSTILSRLTDTPTRKISRPQRQKSLSNEQTKHRRTRSGCYTCRQRRVKCDESRPVCDRCRKGKRDCNYPSKSTSSRSSKNAVKSKSSSSGSSSSDELDHDSQTAVISPDECDAGSVGSWLPPRADSKRSTAFLDDFSGAALDDSNTLARVQSGFNLEQVADWNTYPGDVKFYLEFFKENITYCHYAFKHDCRDFLKTAYLQAAVDFKPLLYALTAFSAYHHALRYPDSKPEVFLAFYDQSLSLFRQCLAAGNASPVPVLLTMLQLATIEEFLGDWVNLVNHQRAAARLIRESYTPEDMAQTFTHRVILVWYWRFDLFAGVLSGNPLTLPRYWFEAVVDFCAQAAARSSADDIAIRFDHYFTYSRLLVTDVTLLFAEYSGKMMDMDTFKRRATNLWAQLQDHAQHVENAFKDVPYYNNIWIPQAPNQESLTDYKDPHFMFVGPYFTMNYIIADSWAARIVFLNRLNLLRQRGLYTYDEPRTPASAILELVLKKCKLFEAMEHSAQCPAGAVLGLQASIGIVALFIPRESKYTDWARRQLAVIETNGYVYPSSYRKRMSDIWNLDVDDWWLPDGEALTPLIKSMRDFIEYRTTSAQRPSDNRDVDVREMNGIFSNMRISQRISTDHSQ